MWKCEKFENVQLKEKTFINRTFVFHSIACCVALLYLEFFIQQINQPEIENDLPTFSNFQIFKFSN